MKTKNTIFIFLTMLLMCSCKNSPQTKIENGKSGKDTTFLITEVQVKEDFQSFLINFQKDSVFQSERIIFPLNNSLYNSETNSFDENIIKQNDWTFMDFVNLPINYLKNIEKVNDDEYQYNIQIEDTGVSVIYIFKLINDKWCLVEIKDEST